MNTRKIEIGIIAGAAIGAVLGVLFAPDKGSATRQKIAKNASDALDKFKQKAEVFSDALVEQYEDGMMTTENVSAKGKANFR